MSIFEQIAWLHRDASTLATNDLVELKHSLKKLIADAEQALDCVRDEIREGRSRTGWPFGPGGA